MSFVLDPARLETDTAATLAIDPLDEADADAAVEEGPLLRGGTRRWWSTASGILLTGGSRYLNLGEPNREIEESSAPHTAGAAARSPSSSSCRT